MATASFKVFTYGTLKKGQPNHWRLESSKSGAGAARYLAGGRTVGTFPLVIASTFNLPFLLYKQGTGQRIHGEVYEVDEAMLTVLDTLEGHPTFYERIVIPIRMSASKEEHESVEMPCWTYVLKNFKPELLGLPYLESYNTHGEHGLPYNAGVVQGRNNDVREEVSF